MEIFAAGSSGSIMTLKTINKVKQLLEKLKKRWPKPMSKEILRLFEETKVSLHSVKKDIGPRAKSSAGKNFSFVKLVSQILKTHDILFLNRHLSYHVLAKADLPLAHGTEEEALAVFSDLLTASARYAGFGSKLEIRIQSVGLREGLVIQTRLCYEGEPLSDFDRQRLLEEIYGSPGKNGAGESEVASAGIASASIADAKNILRRIGGQFWLEFPKETQVVLSFNWPTFEKPKGMAVPKYRTYKYDIWVTDYGRIRQSFGIEKAQKLMTQIEDFARSLVRHPIDIVIAFPEKGLLTTIYEAQEESASSVSTRLSQRLSKEPFRIGRKSVTPKFRYQMTFLA